jgi:hypothetical protein
LNPYSTTHTERQKWDLGDTAACEECAIGHAAEFVIGWGCSGDLAGFSHTS